MFGLVQIWGLSLNRGVSVTEVLILGHYKFNSSTLLVSNTILVKSLLKLNRICESVGKNQVVCAKSVKETQNS